MLSDYEKYSSCSVISSQGSLDLSDGAIELVAQVDAQSALVRQGHQLGADDNLIVIFQLM